MTQNAVIDSQGVYLGMFDEGLEIQKGARRLEKITECDLPVGEYYWKDIDGNVDDLGRPNPFGGAFWPVPKCPPGCPKKGANL